MRFPSDGGDSSCDGGGLPPWQGGPGARLSEAGADLQRTWGSESVESTWTRDRFGSGDSSIYGSGVLGGEVDRSLTRRSAARRKKEEEHEEQKEKKHVSWNRKRSAIINRSFADDGAVTPRRWVLLQLGNGCIFCLYVCCFVISVALSLALETGESLPEVPVRVTTHLS